MPNWQPNWEDVYWNYAAADYAAGQLHRAADHLDSTASAVRQSADTATAEWCGVYRRRFDGQNTDDLRSSWSRAGEYREMAARIRRASQWARDEQARREHERERWRREKADEEARARRARQQRARLAQSGG